MTEGEAAPAATGTPGTRNLTARIVAALVLAPSAIAIAYVGGWLWAALVTLAAIGLYVEWLAIVGEARRIGVVASGVAALALAGIVLPLKLALVALPLGLLAVAALTPERRIWATTGFIYAAAAEQASIMLRSDPAMGWTALMLVFLVVWVTDIGGYFAGRGFGGPKLWPRISPNKTWAGALGGFAASVAVAAGFAAFGLGKAGPLLLLGSILSIVSQLGDLFESAVKRRFGVKDSSRIIPGHGGLLDRLDGFVAAVVLAAILGFLRRGADGVGSGLMMW
ncbi:MAG: phosphatidate cytidylyltransferase [Bradyrhizobium sp.]|uniref:phosphatidate cytidylyltransferase n=1 Tax=Bradyrhizobium sp. TaxID=376 RepID=UPI001C29211A|nr:phosphatidate cytidylyltransferase [Bradyrhizobium sp.]MBU6461860.1 phosphatidate cytidylyltransferase [Pseudomonadota bacterium]MDE2069277.1 phosphatidate cytidylyltransferase [Bradyrhizobium sp.]MDE2243492.1 phosphatidate cytidylyltransferase [Bradyrhizobium sp.]MDE2470195.1 phosphatidate cytidylyltransferase [Bradyrhizobium sp.]